MGQMSQEEINVDLFDEVKRLKDIIKRTQWVLENNDLDDKGKIDNLNDIYYK
jgi:hypothetical protein